MLFEPVTEENFQEWKHHPVTKKLMKMLLSDRENLKEGLINDAFDNEQEVKGRCRAIGVIMSLEYEDLFSSN